LRRELDHWCACRRFVHQFGLIAKPHYEPNANMRNTGRGGREARKPRRRRPSPKRLRKTGPVAVKHQQALAERAAATAQWGRAFTALARVVAAAIGGGRPTTGRTMSHPHRPLTAGQNIGVTACNHPRTGSQSSAGRAHASCNWRNGSGSRSLQLGSFSIATGSQT
jgi:hypothetical protein